MQAHLVSLAILSHRTELSSQNGRKCVYEKG